MDARQDHAESWLRSSATHQVGYKYDSGPFVPKAGLASRVWRATCRRTSSSASSAATSPMDGNAGGHAAVRHRTIRRRTWRCASGTTNGSLAVPGLPHAGKARRQRDGVHGRGDEERRSPTGTPSCSRYQRHHQPGGRLRARRTYSAFVQNVECRKPWHTLTGRPQFYDHDWMMDMGESLPDLPSPARPGAHLR